MEDYEILLKKARIDAIEALREESGYYLYSPTKTKIEELVNVFTEHAAEHKRKEILTKMSEWADPNAEYFNLSEALATMCKEIHHLKLMIDKTNI
jgi:hypothetical protein